MKTLCLLSAIVFLHLPSAFSEEMPAFIEPGGTYAVAFGDGSKWETFQFVNKGQADWWYVKAVEPQTWEGWLNVAMVTKIGTRPGGALKERTIRSIR